MMFDTCTNHTVPYGTALWGGAVLGTSCQATIGVVPTGRLQALLVHRLISRRHTAVGDLADFQGASDEHTLIRT